MTKTKTMTILLAGAALLAGTAAVTVASSAAFGQPFGPGAHRGGPMAVERVLETFDRTGEGRVGQADIDAVRAERHAAFDVDGSGSLALDEYQALWLDAMRERMVRAFQRLDVDGDGQVTPAEFQRPFERSVARLDVDGDGVVTQADADQLWQARQDRRADGRGFGPRGPADGADGMRRGAMGGPCMGDGWNRGSMMDRPGMGGPGMGDGWGRP
jgi:hypothetical protein